MTFVADENFPRPAWQVLRNAGWEVFSVAEECPGISDEEIAALCSENQRVLLTFDKDFGELIFRRGLSAGGGVVLFRFIPESPEEVADAAWHCSSHSPISTGLFALSHESGFESGQCARPRSADPLQDSAANLQSSGVRKAMEQVVSSDLTRSTKATQ